MSITPSKFVIVPYPRVKRIREDPRLNGLIKIEGVCVLSLIITLVVGVLCHIASPIHTAEGHIARQVLGVIEELNLSFGLVPVPAELEVCA
jgi:hypothetical protein